MIITQDVGEPRVQLDLILVQVLVQLLRAQHLGDPDQLVVVVMSKKFYQVEFRSCTLVLCCTYYSC